MKIEAKTAIVTGASSGLGLATAQALVERGGRVFGCDLRAPVDCGPFSDFLAADVTDARQVDEVVREAVRLGGGLHIAVNCAGIGTAGRVLGSKGPLPLERFSAVIGVNLIGTFNVLRVAAEAMSANRAEDGERGIVVNTASVAAFDGQIGQAAYAASKAGVAGMTLPVARDLAEHQIRCVALAPGVFDTPMLATLPERARHALAAEVPHPQRLGHPQEFAALVCHIVENPMLNGEVIRLDGALRMSPR